MRMTTALLALLFTVGCSEGPAGADGADGADGAAGVVGEDGTPGADAADGGDGYAALTETEDFTGPGYGCAEGYRVTWIGVDNGADGGTAGDGVLQDGEVVVETITCLEDLA